jgi:hypothetical protein
MTANRHLAALVWDAQTTADIERILTAVKASSGFTPIPVGRENNIGTIRMASDPGLEDSSKLRVPREMAKAKLKSGCRPWRAKTIQVLSIREE